MIQNVPNKKINVKMVVEEVKMLGPFGVYFWIFLVGSLANSHFLGVGVIKLVTSFGRPRISQSFRQDGDGPSDGGGDASLCPGLLRESQLGNSVIERAACFCVAEIKLNLWIENNCTFSCLHIL